MMASYQAGMNRGRLAADEPADALFPAEAASGPADALFPAEGASRSTGDVNDSNAERDAQ
jgi:hypothetical protein